MSTTVVPEAHISHPSSPRRMQVNIQPKPTDHYERTGGAVDSQGVPSSFHSNPPSNSTESWRPSASLDVGSLTSRLRLVADNSAHAFLKVVPRRPPTFGAHAFPLQSTSATFYVPDTPCLSETNPVETRNVTAFITRSHPHLPSSTLFISNIPPNLNENNIAHVLRECLPVRIRLGNPGVARSAAVTGASSEWTPRSGTLQFDKMHNIEKAMATITAYPSVMERGICISPYAPPYTLPFPDPPVAARSLSPTKLVIPPQNPTNISNGNQAIMIFPTAGELFDQIRPWGTLRKVSVWVVNEFSGTGRDPHGNPRWEARVEFWYEDEAKRFDVGFGQTGSIVKGWQLLICAENARPPVLPPIAIDLPLPSPILVPQLPFTPLLGHMSALKYSLPPRPEPLQLGGDHHHRGHRRHVASTSAMFPSTIPSLIAWPSNSIPQVPLYGHQTPPWTADHTFVSRQELPVSPPHHSPADFDPQGLPFFPFAGNEHTRQSSNSSKNSMSSFRGSTHTRDSKWTLTVDEMPGGGIKTTGLVSRDGTFIAHGPGQQIRPAPFWGPGSNSSSGLVDYSNVYVNVGIPPQHLDPEINSFCLGELFEKVGRIISARVIRDNEGHSKGYGFVSFNSPDEASHAINTMNGMVIGKQTLAVTLHEPRQLRPDKLAERRAAGGSLGYGRQGHLHRRSTSPIRTDRRGRTTVTSDEPKPKWVPEDILSLSPTRRKAALTMRVSIKVHNYARLKAIPDGYIQPTISALVSHDFSLIPLLQDQELLDSKIAETLAVLQDDPDLNVNLGIIKPGRNPTVYCPATREVEELRAEVGRIDPTKVEQLMRVLLADLSVEEIQLCLTNKGAMLARYSAAKTKVIQNQSQGSPSEWTVNQSTHMDGQAYPTRLSESHRESNQRSISLVDIGTDTFDLESLAELPPQDILNHLSSPDGDAILAKLELSRPNSHGMATNSKWTLRVMAKLAAARKTDIAAQLVKKLDSATFRRSQKLSAARELVQADENEEALCALMLYPAILNAIVIAHLDEPRRRASS